MDNQSITVIGDFNVNVSTPYPPCPIARKFLELCNCYGLTNHVHAPTRISPACPSGTTIDLILSASQDISECHVLPLTISDHFGIEANLHLQVSRSVSPQAVERVRAQRNTRSVNLCEFRRDVSSAGLDDFTNTRDVDTMWASWHTKFLAVVDKHAPIRYVSSNRKSHPPWSDRELHKLNQRKNQLHRRWLRDKGNQNLHVQFKQARSSARNAYRRKRKDFFRAQCAASSQNPRKLWNVINSVTNRKRVRVEPTCPIEEVSSVFQAVVTDNARPHSIPLPQGPQPQTAMSELPQVSFGEVERLLRQINPAKATGSDGIPGHLLKCCADILAASVATLFNASLVNGTVPTAFKLAHVIPLFKAGDPSIPTNFRPVSLLPILSKLLEKVVQKKLAQFLDISGTLPTTQFAFRAGHSTEDALVLMLNRILSARDKRLCTGICLLDMSKAFDKVRHERLLQDLFDIGITGTALKWFSAYLSGRTQRICIGRDQSAISAPSCGVPQGSVLGPILFSIYTREVPTIANQSSSVQFADDIALISSSTSLDTVSATLSASVSALADWLQTRGLILNATKSHVIPVYPNRQPQQPQHTINVNCHETPIPVVTAARYLGVLLDSDLSWTPHVDRCTARLAQRIGALWRLRRCLTHQSRVLYFKAIIMSDLMYGSNAFSPLLTANQLDRLQVMQNRAARAVFGLSHHTSARTLLLQLDTYRVSEIFRQKFIVLVWRSRNEHASSELQALLVPSSAGPTRLHSTMGLRQPPVSTRFGKGCLAFRGAQLWNTLPSDIRAISTLRQFRASMIPHTLTGLST